jgi:hypothetical protein
MEMELPMAIEVRVPARGFVHVRPTTPLDLEQAKEMLHGAAEASRENDAVALVLDMRSVAPLLGIGGLWHLAGEMAECASGFRHRTAVLTTPERLDHAEFFALSCQNRGFAVHAFTDYAAAMSWLGESLSGAAFGRPM